MSKLICDCGHKVSALRFINGKSVCDFCQPQSLSGQWERNNAMERQKYAKDILQPLRDGKINPDFVKIYGEKK
jgi:hypothetical protein